MTSINHTLQQGGIPEDISRDIVGTKEYLERVEKTKKSLRSFENYYYSYYRYKYPDDWTVNSFQDFINIFTPIYENKDLISELWFQQYYKMLFKDFLIEFRSVFGEYMGRQFGKGHDDFVFNVVKLVNQKLIGPLEEMNKSAIKIMRK